jgi:hypothetical protein
MTDPDVVIAYRFALAELTADPDAYAIAMAEIRDLDHAHRVIAVLTKNWTGALTLGRLAKNLAEAMEPLASKRKVRRSRIPMGAALTSGVIHEVEDELAFQLDGPRTSHDRSVG